MSVIALSSVTVSHGSLHALSNVTLSIDAGEKVALVGPSGAGKSTLLAVCAGTLAPTSGSVKIMGRAVVGTLQDKQLRRRIGVVHQDLGLVGPLKVIHNVNAGRLGEWRGPTALFSLLRPQGVQAAERVMTRLGIADKMYVRTDTLSGGEQQRVALARIMLQDPTIVLADEPVASLDPARAEEVLSILARIVYSGGRALVVSLHDLAMARRMCDRVIGIRSGKIVFDLPSSAVNNAVRQELYELES